MAEETAKGSVEVIELSRAQQAAGRRAAESRATIPHLYVGSEARVADQITALAPALVRACAFALRECPDLNGAYRDGRLARLSRVNVGVAVEAQDTVLFPTIFDADEKSAQAIGAELSELRTRAAKNEITQPELSGATFSVFTLGGPRVTRVLATIVPGQAAILSAGAPRGADVELMLACDERIAGADLAGAFLGRVASVLEDPSGI